MGGLIGLAILERLVFDLGSNIELVTLATFLAAFYLGKMYAILVPLISLAVSDIFLGNTSIMIFTLSGYLVIALLAVVLSLFEKTGWRNVLLATGGGIVGCLWFYFWTNFGVWLLDSWGMYPNDLSGLYLSYINGLPFLKYHLVSNLVILCTGFSLIETALFIMHNIVDRKVLSHLHTLRLRNSV